MSGNLKGYLALVWFGRNADKLELELPPGELQWRKLPIEGGGLDLRDGVMRADGRDGKNVLERVVQKKAQPQWRTLGERDGASHR